jgi:site-specific DNA recombinase
MTPLRAALYARVSTSEQAERYGLSSQLHELRRLAERKAYTVVGEFIDSGISGAVLERPALTRLREAIRAKQVDVVLTYASDRLARDIGDFLLLRREFRRAGIALEYVDRATDESPHGLFQEHVLAAVDQLERAVIRQRTMRGRLDQARKGIMPGAAAPFGYRRDPAGIGGYVVDEAEAAIVHRMFAWAGDNTSLRGIARRLDAQGVASRRHTGWGSTSVRRILTSTIYVGRGFYNRTRLQESGARLAPRPEAEWIPIAAPALVSQATFDRVQDALARHPRELGGRPSKQPFLLRGLLVCAQCGRSWHGQTASGARRYRCYGTAAAPAFVRQTARATPCRARSVRAEVLETGVWRTVSDVLRDPAFLIQQVRAHQAGLDAERAALQSELAGLRRQAARVEDQRRRLLELYIDGAIDKAAFQARARPLTAAASKTGAEVQRLEATLAQGGVDAKREEAAVRQARLIQRGIDRLDAAGRQRLLRLLVERVVVAENGMTVHGVLPSPKLCQAA